MSFQLTVTKDGLVASRKWGTDSVVHLLETDGCGPARAASPSWGIRRVVLLLVPVAATPVGVAMLAAPRSVADDFSWPIGPPGLAATVGGLYVAAGLAFLLVGLRAFDTWAGQALCAAGIAFAVATLAATLYHAELFDFGRPAGAAWIALFAAAPVVFAIVGRGGQSWRDRRSMTLRVGLAMTVEVAWAVVAVILYFRPSAIEGAMPFALPPMGARFLGAWAALNAVLASALARRDNGLLAVALALFPAGALVALVIDGGDFGRAGFYVTALVLMSLGPLVSTNVRGTAT